MKPQNDPARLADEYPMISFAVEGYSTPSLVTCKSMRHIINDHFRHHPVNPNELTHFVICAQNTLQAEIYDGTTSAWNWGMQRKNTWTDTLSVVIMARIDNRMATAWADSEQTPEPADGKSRDFTRCAYALGLLY